MAKQKQRKPRGKLRQQVRWAIEDQNFWDDDLLVADDMDFKPEFREADRKTDRDRVKSRVRRETHRNLELVDW